MYPTIFPVASFVTGFSYLGVNLMQRESLDRYCKGIVEALRLNEINEIILLSSSYSQDHFESDYIDLMVVIERDTPFKNYEEKLAALVKIRRLITQIENEVNINLFIYTTKEYEGMTANGDDYFRKKIAESTCLYSKNKILK